MFLLFNSIIRLALSHGFPAEIEDTFNPERVQQNQFQEHLISSTFKTQMPIFETVARHNKPKTIQNQQASEHTILFHDTSGERVALSEVVIGGETLPVRKCPCEICPDPSDWRATM